MQTSIVFDQRTWPGAGDVDDCWVVSALQAMNVTSPWLRLIGVPKFREAAGRPDHPNQADGGNLHAIRTGLVGVYPQLSGHVKSHAAVSFQELRTTAAAGHPLSVSIISGALPTSLRFGFSGAHQVTIVVKNGKVLFANPLARAQSRWVRVSWAAIRPAVLAYGHARRGRDCCYFVSLPTDNEAQAIWKPDDTPFDAADVDEATKEIQAKVDAAVAILEG